MDTENIRAPLTAVSGRLSPERVARVEELVRERLSQPIHVEDMAAAAGLSPFHFSRMFHAATGKAPHAYVTAKRMEAACELLATTGMPLAKVATQVGYRTQAHFTGVFHRHVGVTPRTYRVSRTAGAATPARNPDGAGEEDERAFTPATPAQSRPGPSASA
jgi:AraC family transcriptional regulator